MTSSTVRVAGTISILPRRPDRRYAVVTDNAETRRLQSDDRELSIVPVLTGSSILVAGETGSFGRAFIRHARQHLDTARIVVFSRDHRFDTNDQWMDADAIRENLGAL